jgi:hypothetical protein
MVATVQAAVLKRLGGQAPMRNPTYGTFADHLGFTIAPCNVGQGNAKGRGENGVGYVKQNCRAGLDLPPFSALPPAATRWLETVATGRLQGETRQPPRALWHKEQSYLRPLPPPPCDLATVSPGRAAKPCRSTVETNRSSVPAPRAGHVLPLKT